jgi:hypothetical protein
MPQDVAAAFQIDPTQLLLGEKLSLVSLWKYLGKICVVVLTRCYGCGIFSLFYQNFEMSFPRYQITRSRICCPILDILTYYSLTACYLAHTKIGGILFGLFESLQN